MWYYTIDLPTPNPNTRTKRFAYMFKLKLYNVPVEIMVQVMTWFLSAPSHCLNQCWFLISEVLRFSSKRAFTASAQIAVLYKEFEHYTRDDVIKWKHFPRYCPFVRGIHLSLVNSPHKGQWRGALIFDLHLNRRLSIQSRRRWFEVPSR